MVNGILNIYKEKGYTSHDVVAILRKTLNQKKIGHTGTLDPEAEGVLPICIGKGTKVSSLLTEKDKVYETILTLGITTDTQDYTGKILEKKEVNITKDKLNSVIKSFEGEYNQVPPMFSAIKVQGKKLYELARKGIEVERKSRKVNIYRIEILGYIDGINIKLKIECSKGTYIRTLCHDIGQKLGCGGHMSYLLRTRVGIFKLENSMKLDRVVKLYEEQKLIKNIYNIDKLFDYPQVIVTNKYNKFLYNGNKLSSKALKTNIIERDKKLRVYDEHMQFVGIYQYIQEQEVIKPIKIFL
ncbi:MAG: tRNA pseudouridine(55) synthase TruB [Eubacteriales bacterium]